MNKKIILASGSPRRRELLSSLGLDFEVIKSDFEEDIENKAFSNELIITLAEEKVKDVIKKTNTPSIIIGADTVVIIDNQILGKPVDKKDAFKMLRQLSGRTHEVVTAIAVFDTIENKMKSEAVTSKVTFKALTDEEINNYIKTGEPMDKAGSYGIQAYGALFVSSINGCYFNIVGLSIQRLSVILKEFGINIL
ncbi:MAG: Maf family protein [bacterium]